MVTDHLEKAAMIWDKFRKRLSYSVHSKMQFNLADYSTPLSSAD
jgi:hypothetical protein